MYLSEGGGGCRGGGGSGKGGVAKVAEVAGKEEEDEYRPAGIDEDVHGHFSTTQLTAIDCTAVLYKSLLATALRNITSKQPV